MLLYGGIEYEYCVQVLNLNRLGNARTATDTPPRPLTPFEYLTPARLFYY